VSTARARDAALAQIEALLEAGGDADDVLRAVLSTIEQRLEDVTWIALQFVEEGQLIAGPTAGQEPSDGARLELAVTYEGRQIGRLDAAGQQLDDADRAFFERVSGLISAHTLLGWDTGGERWVP
jgi:hypothetical protein